jgi:hypothetical protein
VDARQQTFLAAQGNREDRQKADALLLERSRKRLAKNMDTKILTSFIGAIAQIEEKIGRNLWGHNLSEDECSPEQLAWRKVWSEARTEILNNGNNQRRAAANEITQYEVKWNRCSVTLPVQRSNDDAE